MKLKTSTLVVLMLALWNVSHAQVDGLSYEVGGIGEYMFFDKEVGIEDGAVLGGEFGFGLGRLLELRGSYHQGINLQRDFDGLEEDFVGLPELDVDYRQYGGDIQFNLIRSAIKPYVMAGAGVVDIEGDRLDESSSLYVRGGLGVLLTAHDRFAWNLFGTVNTFSTNPYSTLLSDTERAIYDIDLAEKDFDNTLNYSVGTKFTFYLGGRSPNKETELDAALRNSFQSGLRGITLEVEPTYSWLDFDEELPYADGQAIGIKLGADFGPYFGVRGFYHRGMEDGEFLEFEELNMYGGEMVFNLNEPSGIVPFVSVGGGYLDIGDDYVGRPDVDAQLEDKPYAMGGLGLRVPLADVFLLKGSARALIMTNEELEDVVSTQDVTTSWMYQVGVEFKLGKKAKKPEVVEMSEYEKALYDLQKKAEAEAELYEQDGKSNKEINKLKKKIAMLEAEKMASSESGGQPLDEESEDNDADDMHKGRTTSGDEIVIPTLEQGEVYIRFGETNNTLTHSAGAPAPQIVEMVDSSSVAVQDDVPQPVAPVVHDTVYVQPDGIVMQPDELKELLKSVAQPVPAHAGSGTDTLPNAVGQASLLNRYHELRVQNRILELELEQERDKLEALDGQYKARMKQEMKMERMRYEQKLLEKELQETKKALREEEKSNAEEKSSVAPQQRSNASDLMQNVDSEEDLQGVNDSLGKWINYKHTSGMLFTGLGEANGLGLGFRFHFGIPKTDIDVVPQVYYGLAGQRQYGFDINFQKPVMKQRFVDFEPYVGLGLGLAGLEEDNDVVDNTATFNFILGTKYHTNIGHFYFDYTNRNFFNMNQLSAGYVFNF